MIILQIYVFMIKMARIHVFLILLVQGFLLQAAEVAETIKEADNSSEEATNNDEDVKKPTTNDKDAKDYHKLPKDWMEMFLGAGNTLLPTASASLMAQAVNSNKTAEEQMKDIKNVAGTIGKAIQSELVNLLAFAMVDKDPTTDNKLRNRRSTTNPLDSTKLVMRLLKHIKSNNEYQNLAIEKMMTAQEIADKYGIEFTPDTDVLSDLALAANNHASDLTNLLEDACKTEETKKEDVESIPLDCEIKAEKPHNHTYYVYSVYPEETPYMVHQNKPAHCDIHLNLCHHDHDHKHNAYETQIPRPPVHQTPVTPKPSYYEAMSYPHQEIYCSADSKPTTVLLPGEDDFEPEPVLTGEEFEETISSKVFIDHEDENGESTVNHVMTYTVAEKSHFKKPEIEKLPEHMQYCFLLL